MDLDWPALVNALARESNTLRASIHAMAEGRSLGEEDFERMVLAMERLELAALAIVDGRP